tara:strand:+ start:3304 stop:5772 length:2469 start_codon:yes stop_codon:yes gene_type:complete
MAVEKAMIGVGEPADASIDEVEIEIVNPEAVSIETPDGGMVIDFDPDMESEEDFGSNLAEYLEESELGNIKSELIGAFEADRSSRSDWEETYIKGLDLLGLKIEDRTTPWPGACGVFHPVLSEAVIRFQAQSIMETFPAKGPVRTQIIGDLNEEKEEQAVRVQNEMNYQLTEGMPDYRSEHENMLFALPLAGSAFKKVYYDPDMERPTAVFVPAEDMVVAYGASDLNSCGRYTHVMKKTKNEIRKLQIGGFYRDVELGEPSPDYTKVQEQYNALQGERPAFEYDDRYTLLECHVDLDLANFEDEKDGEPTGIALPYVVTLDKSSGTILSIYRNWEETDPLKKKMLHFVHYKYLPSLGFYGYGLIHCIGGLTKSATSILRQLVDAGTLSNLPAGLKARGLRIKGDETPIMPGEFRDVDVPGGAIRDNITFMPYKEPSNVLYQLLGNIVEEGRRFASLADMKISDMNNEAPVGTTLAIIERGMKVMSAVQARLHASMRKEFGIISNLIKTFLPADYAYETGASRAEDFDGRVDVIPVSDPNATTMAQRVMQYQAALQLASQAPQMYDLPELHRQMLMTMGLQDVNKIVPDKDDVKPTDPVTENENLINEKPVKAFSYQDHKAHITVHMNAIKDPKIMELVSQSPRAGAIQSAAESHIREHLTFEYRNEIEKQLGVPLPPEGEPLPRDVEKELSVLLAQASDKLLAKDQAEVQQQQAQQMLQDPIVQQQQEELNIRRMEVERKAQADMMRAKVDMDKAEMTDARERERIASQEKITGAQIGARIASDVLEGEFQGVELAEKEKMEGARLGVEIAKAVMDKEGREG